MTTEPQEVTWGSESAKRKDRRQQKLRAMRSNFKFWLHGVFWRFLWAVKLGKPYGKLTCRLGLYRKFPDGRCMYCGEIK